jgi:hypothetical protein
MAEIFLRKVQGVLIPDSEGDADKLAAIANGETIRADIKRPRNIKFHRKYFALLDVLYDLFQPDEQEERLWYKGIQPIKNRERFRYDIAIATGFYEMVYTLKGEVRAEAKSISFANMEQDVFDSLFSKTIDYGLLRIAKGKTREELENWTNAILDFA